MRPCSLQDKYIYHLAQKKLISCDVIDPTHLNNFTWRIQDIYLHKHHTTEIVVYSTQNFSENLGNM
jgi:hypothetical protein